MTYLVWVLIDTQNLLAETNEALIGFFLFLFIVGLVQNFTLKLGAYDIGGLLELFGGVRNRVLDNANKRVEDEKRDNLRKKKKREREIQMKLEQQHSLQELIQILHAAFAYASIPLTKRNAEIDELGQNMQSYTDAYKKPYYAQKIIKIGGMEFAEDQIDEN